MIEGTCPHRSTWRRTHSSAAPEPPREPGAPFLARSLREKWGFRSLLKWKDSGEVKRAMVTQRRMRPAKVIRLHHPPAFSRDRKYSSTSAFPACRAQSAGVP